MLVGSGERLNPATGVTEADYFEALAGLLPCEGPDSGLVIGLACGEPGTGVVYRKGDEGGRMLAGLLQEGIVEALGLPDRGIGPRFAHDRGGDFLYGGGECVIVEPFCIERDGEFLRASVRMGLLAEAIVGAVEEFNLALEGA